MLRSRDGVDDAWVRAHAGQVIGVLGHPDAGPDRGACRAARSKHADLSSDSVAEPVQREAQAIFGPTLRKSRER